MNRFLKYILLSLIGLLTFISISCITLKADSFPRYMTKYDWYQYAGDHDEPNIEYNKVKFYKDYIYYASYQQDIAQPAKWEGPYKVLVSHEKNGWIRAKYVQSFALPGIFSADYFKLIIRRGHVALKMHKNIFNSYVNYWYSFKYPVDEANY